MTTCSAHNHIWGSEGLNLSTPPARPAKQNEHLHRVQKPPTDALDLHVWAQTAYLPRMSFQCHSGATRQTAVAYLMQDLFDLHAT
jgi:hypothetical protein